MPPSCTRGLVLTGAPRPAARQAGQSARSCKAVKLRRAVACAAAAPDVGELEEEELDDSEPGACLLTAVYLKYHHSC